jgi:transposase
MPKRRRRSFTPQFKAHVVDGLFYILRTGCKGRHLPEELITLVTAWARVTSITARSSGSQAGR